MSNTELHVLRVDAHLGDFIASEQYIQNPKNLDQSDFNVRPLIRTVKSWKISAGSFRALISLVKSSQLDALCLFIPGYPNLYQPFPHRNPIKNITGTAAYLTYLSKYFLAYLLAKRCQAPVLLFDRLDASVIDKRWHRFLAICRRYYKRELPKCPANAFLYSERVAAEPWSNADRYASYVLKLHPFTDGVSDEIVSVPLSSCTKDIDIFWAGNVTISPVRENGLKLLRKLADKGYKVEICETKVSKEKFYELIRRSYLVWSPEGTGWQCWKHYEACAMESVPVISYPTIWQDMPLLDGEHCFYYDPEKAGLVDVVERILQDKERLVTMGKNARPYVLRNHTQLSGYLRAVFDAVEK